jgi:hypothetical protein
MALSRRALVDHLRAELEARRMVLFTGAGFSNDTQDLDGTPIPTGRQLRRELWELCFPRSEPDESSLADLFHHALKTKPHLLRRLLGRRLRIDPQSLRARHRLWFTLPWSRIYTLNVDDLETAAARRFGIARMRAISALRPAGRPRRAERGSLEIVHLNGVIDDGPEGITFSMLQYGERLARRCRFYTQLVKELRTRSFLIVGTQLGEAPLWQHVELAAPRHAPVPRPRRGSILVARRLDRARQSLLRDLGIEWVPMSARDFADGVLAQLPPALFRS